MTRAVLASLAGLLLASGLALGVAGGLGAGAGEPGDALVLEGGRIVDGTGRPPIQGSVLIAGGRIQAVGLSAPEAAPPGARRIDVSGHTVLPGFINAHVHLEFPHLGTGLPSRWLEEGVTTVCDLASPLDRIAELKTAPAGHPRVVAAGPILSVPGGYPESHWGPAIHLSARGPADARARVAQLLDAGADVVKIAVEGAGSRRLPTLSDAEIEAVVEAAHARGVRVVAHVDLAANLERLVDRGVDAAVHMIRDALSDQLIQKMVARDVHLVPTLGVMGDRPVMGKNVRRFVAAGGKLALGDDWGNPGTSTGMPWSELTLLRRAGLSPMQIIVAATSGSAWVCGRDRELGVLAPGLLADVLVVGGDPVTSLPALASVALVLKGGRIVAGRRAGSGERMLQ